ncbi:MAG TPA: BamA/TamA family outer membrane protein [Kofleriaceae bacterium]
MRSAIVIIACAVVSAVTHAAPPFPPDDPLAPPAEPPDAAPDAAPAPSAEPPPPPPAPANTAPSGPSGPIAGFAVRGPSKVKPRTIGYLAHVAIGDRIGPGDLPRLQQALLSSELFTSVSVALEPASPPSSGVIVVVTADDKHSWIAAPTVFALPGNFALGVGFAENDFRGLDQKFLLYGQLGTRTSLLFSTFLDPSYHGTQLTWRTDLYLYRRGLNEYVNPPDNPRSFAIERTTRSTYLGGGALIGWNFLWWLAADLRLRGAYVYFRDPRDAADQPIAKAPEKDGWDFTLQAHLTIDHRHHRYGVTWGTYAQLDLEPSIPRLSSYDYQLLQLRAYHSWRLFDDHELELRGHFNAGRHLPLHEDFTLGGVSDLRGYDVDQFRGDLRAVARAEYSIPLFQWRFFAFRAIGFYDAGYVGFHSGPTSDRDFLLNQLGPGYTRSDVGAGLRVYLNNIVLPLLGFDLGYGIEGHSPEIYFEVGLTDF